jgi:hypothetical protein
MEDPNDQLQSQVWRRDLCHNVTARCEQVDQTDYLWHIQTFKCRAAFT